MEPVPPAVKKGPAGPVDKAHSGESYYLSGGRSMGAKKSIELAQRYIQDYIDKVGAAGVVIGISGGVDSTVAAQLACRALSPQQVLGLILPYKTTDPRSLEDAEAVVKHLNIPHQTIDITPQIDAYYAQCSEGDEDYLRIGNKAARERMAVLYDQAQARNYLVLGTSNKTEWLLGYFTLWGDMAAALEPVEDLYKTQVLELARVLGVAERIINKAPTADLWPGQTDEQEIGVGYAEIDRILYRHVEYNETAEEICKSGLEREKVEKVLRMMHRTSFKRKLPDVLQLQYCWEGLQ